MCRLQLQKRKNASERRSPVEGLGSDGVKVALPVTSYVRGRRGRGGGKTKAKMAAEMAAGDGLGDSALRASARAKKNTRQGRCWDLISAWRHGRKPAPLELEWEGGGSFLSSHRKVKKRKGDLRRLPPPHPARRSCSCVVIELRGLDLDLYLHMWLLQTHLLLCGAPFTPFGRLHPCSTAVGRGAGWTHLFVWWKIRRAELPRVRVCSGTARFPQEPSNSCVRGEGPT